jgi:hypothetical protein
MGKPKTNPTNSKLEIWLLTKFRPETTQFQAYADALTYLLSGSSLYFN